MKSKIRFVPIATEQKEYTEVPKSYFDKPKEPDVIQHLLDEAVKAGKIRKGKMYFRYDIKLKKNIRKFVWD